MQPAPPSEPPSSRQLKRGRADQQAALVDSIQKAVSDGIQAGVPLTRGSESFVHQRLCRSSATLSLISDSIAYDTGAAIRRSLATMSLILSASAHSDTVAH